MGAGTVVAQERMRGTNQQQPRSWWEKETVQVELDLSSQQVGAIANIEEQNLKLTREHRKAQQQAYRNMIKVLTMGSPTEAEITESRLALEEAWVESVRQNVEHWVKLREQLSPEQWVKLPRVAPRALQLGGFRTHAMGTIRVGVTSD
jgi:hypothetical protein